MGGYIRIGVILQGVLASLRGFFPPTMVSDGLDSRMFVSYTVP